MKIEFNKMLAEDVNKVIPMIRQLYQCDNIPLNEITAVEALINLINNQQHGRAFTISYDDDLAGYLIMTFGYSLEFKGRDAFIDELFIKEEFRGNGIGTNAIVYAESICKESGIKALHLEVERENFKAQSVYRKAGFMDHNRYLLTKWIE